MRLGIISDVHFDVNQQFYPKVMSKLKLKLLNEKIDLFVLAGDMAGGLEALEQSFAFFSDLDIPKIYVPGNHCLWTSSESNHASLEYYTHELPKIAKDNNWHYLPRNPIRIGDCVFVGSIGWYDYSTRNPKWDGEEFIDLQYREKESRHGMWMDKKYIKFPLDDPSMSEMFLKQLMEDYQLIQPQIQNGDTLFFVTHIVPYLDDVVYKNNFNWDFFSAFIGDVKIGKFYDSLDLENQIYAIFGHTHFVSKHTRNNDIKTICSPLGYPQENRLRPLEEVLEEKLFILDID